ncbi:MAG TPA: carboxypeptidase-like regulatory domain-containing protein, partial [Candidatus Binatia bacterium]
DVHDWMSGWFFVAAHPYFSVSDENGAFSLSHVPPGSYTVEVWHEKLGTQSKKVDVAADGKVEVNFEFAAPSA